MSMTIQRLEDLLDAKETSTSGGRSSTRELKRQALENEELWREVEVEEPWQRYQQVWAGN